MTNKVILTLLATLSLSAQASIKEDAVIELGESLVQSLLEAKLEMACETHINHKGEISLNVNQKCIETTNALRSALAQEPTAYELVERVDSFMDSNDIPVSE